jgi:uncharacterized membrane protein
MLTWGVVIALAIGVLAQRVAGATLIDSDRIGVRSRRVLDALPLAIIAAVIGLATLSSNGELEVDARVGGVAVAALCASRRLPMFVTVIAAATATAVIRFAA